jgi:endoplasmic reticulum-Golgi intermediate compartment protein 3
MDLARNKTSAKDYCGSCYGANPDKNACCNTCDEVRSAYRMSGWSLDNPDDFEQVMKSCFHF